MYVDPHFESLILNDSWSVVLAYLRVRFANVYKHFNDV